MANAAVNVRAPDGTLGTVAPQDLAQAIDAGAEQVTPEELRKVDLEEKYGGVGGGLAATGLAAARGRTFGLSDVAGSALGYREAIKGYEEANPIASTIGEVLGVLAPGGALGGAGLVARGARAEAGLAGLAAREAAPVAKVAGKGVGLGADGLGGAFWKAADVAPGEVARVIQEANAGGGLAEVAARTGSGRRIWEAVKDAADITGAIPQAATGLGGIAERGVGAIVGTGAESLAGRMVQRGLATAAQGAVEGALYEGGMQLSEDALGDHETTAEKLFAAAQKGAIFGGTLGGALGSVGELVGHGAEGLAAYAAKKLEKDGGLDGVLGHAAEEFALKAAGARVRDYKKLGRDLDVTEERVQSMGRRLLDDELVTAGDTTETIARKVNAKVESTGKELGDLVTKLDTAPARMDVNAVSERIAREVVEPLMGLPGRAADANEVLRYWSEFAQKAGEAPSFETVNRFRRDLDKSLVEKFNKPEVAAHDSLMKVRGILEEEFELAAERASQQLGEGVAGKYKTLKAEYADLAKIREISTREAMNAMAASTASFGDKVMGGLGLAALGPKGLMLAYANKLVRERGNQVAADLLDKASRLEGIQRLSQRLDNQLTSKVRGFLAEGERGATTAAVLGSEAPRRSLESTKATILAVRQLAGDPAQMQERVGRLVAPVSRDAPNVASALAMKATAAVTFLSSRAPQPRVGQGLLMHHQVPRFADADVATFGRYLDAIEHPQRVLDDARNLKLSRHGIEAVREVYPQMFAQMQREVITEIGKLEAAGTLQKRMPWEKQKQVSILLGVPATQSLTPEFLRAMQESTQVPSGSPEPGGGQPAQQQQMGGRRPYDGDPQAIAPFSTTIGGVQ